MKKNAFFKNAFFKLSDYHSIEIQRYIIPPEWWSRLYEYPWALRFARRGMTVADMGAGWQYRPFKDALSLICKKVYAVDWGTGLLDQPRPENVEFVVAGFTNRIQAIPENSLDRVFCISVLEELEEGMLLPALQEFYTCLKPGGLCVISVDVQYDMDKPLGVYKGVDLEELAQAIKAAGFETGEFDLDKENAVVNEQFNLCVFYCVLEKPS